MSKEIHILSLGAGVQSSTLALMATYGEITPMPVAAIFADTGDEPKAVYGWLNQLETWLSFPLVRVRKATGTLSADSTKVRERRDGTGSYVRQPIPGFVNDKGKPKLLTRGCTRDYKIRPITTAARQLKRQYRATRVIDWLGISTDEADRMAPSREHDIEIRWPLIERGMSRSACLAWLKERSLPHPPRSACVFCPFHADAEWARLKRDEPEDFASAVAYEQRLHSSLAQSTRPTSKHGRIYLHKSLIPLSEVQFSDSTRSGFGNECKGRCGV